MKMDGNFSFSEHTTDAQLFLILQVDRLNLKIWKRWDKKEDIFGSLKEISEMTSSVVLFIHTLREANVLRESLDKEALIEIVFTSYVGPRL